MAVTISRHPRRKPVRVVAVSSKAVSSLSKGNRRRRHNKLEHATLRIRRSPCPAQIIVPLKYVSDLIQLTCTAGASATHLFNLNNVFDPDRSGVGHQPLGRDEWSAFYGVYRVLSSSITIWMKNATDNKPFRLVLGANGITTGALGIDAGQEGRQRVKIGGHDNAIVKFGMFTKMHDAFNIPASQYYNADAYRASTGAAPARQGVWQIYAQPFDESTQTNLDFKVEITYYVNYSNPKFIAQS